MKLAYMHIFEATTFFLLKILKSTIYGILIMIEVQTYLSPWLDLDKTKIYWLEVYSYECSQNGINFPNLIAFYFFKKIISLYKWFNKKILILRDTRSENIRVGWNISSPLKIKTNLQIEISIQNKLINSSTVAPGN